MVGWSSKTGLLASVALVVGGGKSLRPQHYCIADLSTQPTLCMVFESLLNPAAGNEKHI